MASTTNTIDFDRMKLSRLSEPTPSRTAGRRLQKLAGR